MKVVKWVTVMGICPHCWYVVKVTAEKARAGTKRNLKCTRCGKTF